MKLYIFEVVEGLIILVIFAHWALYTCTESESPEHE
jgi:hypothetical protein